VTTTFRSDFISLLHAISVRTSEQLSLSRQCGFASPAQLLSFLAVNQTQIVTWITTSGYQAAPILRRCPTRGLPECTGEIGLTRKTEREGDIGQGPIRIREQFLGALQTPCADMPMLDIDPAPSCIDRVAGPPAVSQLLARTLFGSIHTQPANPARAAQLAGTSMTARSERSNAASVSA